MDMPRLPAHAMTTYRLYRPAEKPSTTTCQKAGCLAYRHGWDTTLDLAKPEHAKAAAVIRASSRTFTEVSGGGTIVVFRFEPGQTCFAVHRTAVQYIRRGGAPGLGNPRQELFVHRSPGDWVEDFAEHQDKLAEAVKAG